MGRVGQGEAWRRSTKCDSCGCVEVAMTDEFVYVRNSNEPDGARLVFTYEEWTAFRNGILDGEFAAA